MKGLFALKIPVELIAISLNSKPEIDAEEEEERLIAIALDLVGQS